MLTTAIPVSHNGLYTVGTSYIVRVRSAITATAELLVHHFTAHKRNEHT